MGKKVFVILLVLTSFSAMSQTKVKQTAGHDALGEFAPEFAHLNDNVLFGEVWSRNDLLSLRDRSMITVTALVSQDLTDSSLLHHLQFAKKNGITRTEIAEIITHVAFMPVGLRHGLHSILQKRCGMRKVPIMTQRTSFKKK